MNNRKQWIENKIKQGWMFLIAGILLGAAGIVTASLLPGTPFNFRLITGLGIVLIGIGISSLIRYPPALKNEQLARDLTVNEHDERTVLIQTRAGNRAYWVTALIIYGGLMWESFAAIGSLPAIQGDGLWYFLVGAVLVPFGVYITSILIDQNRL